MPKQKPGVFRPTLTPMDCLECGRPPDYSCPYCPAMLCADCLAEHEDKRHLLAPDQAPGILRGRTPK